MATLYLCGAGNSEGVRLALRVNERSARWDRILLLDDDPARHGGAIVDVPIVGAFDRLADAAPGDEVANLVARTTRGRRAAQTRIEQFGVPFTSLISPTVDLLGAAVADDVIVYQHATVGPEVTIGAGAVVFMGAVVGHESHVDRGCVIAANAVLNARVELGEYVYVGTNAAILPEIVVGAGATIGAGSAVLQDVAPGATVMGVPAEPIMQRSEAGAAANGAARFNGRAADDGALRENLCILWQDLLKKPRIGLGDNFFELGGTSLIALQMRSRVHQRFGVDLALSDIFKHPTVEALATHLEAAGYGGSGASASPALVGDG